MPRLGTGCSLWRPAIAVTLLGSVVLLGGSLVQAQTTYRLHQPKERPGEGRTSGAESERYDLSRGTTPARWVESRRESEGRRVETRRLETLSVEGGYQPLVEIEEETVEVDPGTTRVIRRLFARDPDGRRQLIERTEEDQLRLPGDQRRLIRTISKPDLSGRLRLTRREVQETARVGAHVEETRTTVFLPDINGGLTAAEEIREVESQEKEDLIKSERTHLLRDGNGRWHSYERRERVVESGPKVVRTEERLYRRDANRQLSLTERTVSREWKDATGQEQRTVETYSTTLAGTTRYSDGRLHLDRRLRIVRQTRPDGGQQTVQELEQRRLVAPAEGLGLAERVVEISRPAGRGRVEKEQTVYGFDANGRRQKIIVRKTDTTEP